MYLVSPGAQLTYSWARPAILVAAGEGKGE